MVLYVVNVFLTEILFRNSETVFVHTEFEQISEYIVDNESTYFLCWIRKL